MDCDFIHKLHGASMERTNVTVTEYKNSSDFYFYDVCDSVILITRIKVLRNTSFDVVSYYVQPERMNIPTVFVEQGREELSLF